MSDEIRKAQDLFDLSGEVALVTGASSGLGWRFARVLAAHGASVVLAARSAGKLEDLKALIEADGGKAAVVEFDVSDREKVPGLFDAAEAAFGTVTILVNNAGIAKQTAFLDLTEEEWEEIRDVNYEAVWRIAQEAARRMVAAESGGSIINIASLWALRVSKTLSTYAVTKAAVVQLTKAMALELARHKVRVNAIAPGYILTEMNRAYFESPESASFVAGIPQKRVADPSELDGTLLLLASDASSFTTGSVIVVDGGHSLSA